MVKVPSPLSTVEAMPTPSLPVGPCGPVAPVAPVGPVRSAEVKLLPSV